MSFSIILPILLYLRRPQRVGLWVEHCNYDHGRPAPYYDFRQLHRALGAATASAQSSQQPEDGQEAQYAEHD